MLSDARRYLGVGIAIAMLAVATSSASADAPPPASAAPPASPPQATSNPDADGPTEYNPLFTNTFLSVGAGATYGVGPGVTGMHSLTFGLRRWPLVFLVETQILWGGWRKPAEDTLVEWNGQIVPLALCYQRRGFLACGVYASARLEAKGFRGKREATSTMTYPADNASWFSTAGVRAGYEVRLFGGFYLHAYVDLLKTLSQPSLHGGGGPIWQVSPIVGSAGLYLNYTLGLDHGRKPLFD